MRNAPEEAGQPVERSVGMRADYLRPRLDLLRARLEPGERVLAKGRAFEPYRDSFALSELISGPGCAVAVTDRRVLWVSRSDRRWMRILPYAAVRSYLELLQEACQRAGIPGRASPIARAGAPLSGVRLSRPTDRASPCHSDQHASGSS
jgi:hypothetical protein